MKNKEKEIWRLYDYTETISTIYCSSCGASDSSHAGDDYAPEEFYRRGWNATRQGNCYCPECSDKKLKKREHAKKEVN